MSPWSRWLATIVIVGGTLIPGVVGVTGLWQAAAEPEVGARAPDFTLPATTGGTISLSQFRGKKIVLLEFYGADFSPV